MSCLPLFYFSPSIPSVLNPYDDLPGSKSGGQRPATPATTPKANGVADSRYDKLSQVSVTHRRVDSFEWVMTQSAPNTPPTSLGSKNEPYSPPPAKLFGSAPLPVPNETWSTISRPCDQREKRGYFDWWSSPSLQNGKGYARISAFEEGDEPDVLASTSNVRRSVEGPTKSLRPKAQVQTPVFSSTDGNQLRPSQEFNALGIVFPCTPPPSPPASIASKAPRPSDSFKAAPGVAAPRLPKRVSFSPVIDEVVLETFPNSDFERQPPSSWGSYLPSSFLVARPILPRKTSCPVPRRTIAARPILKHSTSFDHQPIYDSTSSTEMTRLSTRTKAEDTVSLASPIPSQRLSVAALRADGHRKLGGKSLETDSVFVTLLQAAQKPAHRQCHSLFCSVDEDCKSP